MNFKKQANYLAARPQPLFQLQPAGRFAGMRWRGIRAPASAALPGVARRAGYHMPEC